MTPAHLDAIKAREQAATEGPWRALTKQHPEAVRLRKEGVGVSAEECQIYRMSRDYGCLPETFERQRADAEFIAHARQDIPALLDEVARLSASPQPNFELWGVFFDGELQAAYPRQLVAEAYGSGYSRPCEIRKLQALASSPQRPTQEPHK